MKKFALVLAVLILSGFVGFQVFSASIRKSLANIENAAINMNNVADGVYSGHSELGPVSVDVEDLLSANADSDENGVSATDIAANEFDSNSLFDDFDDLDE